MISSLVSRKTNLLSAEPRRNTTLSLGSTFLNFAVCLIDLLHCAIGSILAVLVEFALGLCEFCASFVGLSSDRLAKALERR
jgi:hypothetical protein